MVIRTVLKTVARKGLWVRIPPSPQGLKSNIKKIKKLKENKHAQHFKN